MNVKAMLELADHMESVPRNKFYMGSYGTIEDSPEGTVTLRNRQACETTCCIAGEKVLLDGGKMFLDPDAYSGVSFAVKGKRVIARDYAGERLGIEYLNQRQLFHNFSLETPKQAAKFIRKMVREYESEAQP